MEYLGVLFTTCLMIILPGMRQAFVPASVPGQTRLSGRIKHSDVVRGLAMLGVIIIHVGYVMIDIHPGFDFNFFAITNNLTRFAIPIFFISSGMLLAAKPFSIKDRKNFYTKKIVRIFIPYIFVNAIIAWSEGFTGLAYFRTFITGEVLPPFYFIIILFQFYLLYPLLVEAKDKRWFVWLCFFISLFSYVTPQAYFIYGIPFFARFLFFFVYGMYIRNYILAPKENLFKFVKKSWFYWLVWIIIYLTLTFWLPTVYFNVRFFYGLAIFFLLWYFKDHLEKLKDIYSWLASIGRLSLWIYLIHFSFLYFVYSIFSPLTKDQYVLYTLILVVGTVGSYLLAYILDRTYKAILQNRINK